MNKFLNTRGQVMPYYLAIMMVLLLCWAMVLNIAKLLRDRIMMQNAADNAVLSVAVLRARTLNLVGASNCLMAVALGNGSYPFLVPIPMFNIGYIGGSISDIPFPFSDVKCDYSILEKHTDYGGVNRLRYTVNSIREFQKALVLSYPVNAVRVADAIGKRQEINREGKETGSDSVVVVPAELFGAEGGTSPASLTLDNCKSALSGLSPEKLLGLKRNERRITYFKTINVGGTLRRHYHFTGYREWLTDEHSWYTADDRFFQQKIIAVAAKSPGSRSNDAYPVLKRFIGNDPWPSIVTVAAAATYNTRGSMFPVNNDVYTGIPWYLALPAIISFKNQLENLEAAAKDIQLLPAIGQILGGAMAAGAVGIAIYAGYSFSRSLFNDETPVRKYEEAEYAGWDAHLVPVGKIVKH